VETEKKIRNLTEKSVFICIFSVHIFFFIMLSLQLTTDGTIPPQMGEH